jgi:hypothetical protein
MTIPITKIHIQTVKVAPGQAGDKGYDLIIREWVHDEENNTLDIYNRVAFESTHHIDLLINDAKLYVTERNITEFKIYLYDIKQIGNDDMLGFRMQKIGEVVNVNDVIVEDTTCPSQYRIIITENDDEQLVLHSIYEL